MRAGGERVCDGVFALHDSGVGGQDVRGKLNAFRSELYFASFLPLDNLHRIIMQKKNQRSSREFFFCIWTMPKPLTW